MLRAREARWKRRLALAEVATPGGCLVTATPCAPQRYRTGGAFAAVFEALCLSLLEALERRGVAPHAADWLDGADGPALFLLCDAPPAAVKAACVAAEEALPGGRLLDADVMTPEGGSVGREQLGLPPRRCLVCDGPAAACVAGRVHPRSEVEARVEALAPLALRPDI